MSGRGVSKEANPCMASLPFYLRRQNCKIYDPVRSDGHEKLVATIAGMASVVEPSACSAVSGEPGEGGL